MRETYSNIHISQDPLRLNLLNLEYSISIMNKYGKCTEYINMCYNIQLFFSYHNNISSVIIYLNYKCTNFLHTKPLKQFRDSLPWLYKRNDT